MKWWENRDNQREFLDNLGEQLGFKKMENWYNITVKQIIENKGGSLLVSRVLEVLHTN